MPQPEGNVDVAPCRAQEPRLQRVYFPRRLKPPEAHEQPPRPPAPEQPRRCVKSTPEGAMAREEGHEAHERGDIETRMARQPVGPKAAAANAVEDGEDGNGPYHVRMQYIMAMLRTRFSVPLLLSVVKVCVCEPALSMSGAAPLLLDDAGLLDDPEFKPDALLMVCV